jgi:hypothetical protein
MFTCHAVVLQATTSRLLVIPPHAGVILVKMTHNCRLDQIVTMLQYISSLYKTAMQELIQNILFYRITDFLDFINHWLI